MVRNIRRFKKKEKEDEVPEDEENEESLDFDNQRRRVRFAKTTTILSSPEEKCDVIHSIGKGISSLKVSDKHRSDSKTYKIVEFDSKWGKRKIRLGEILDYNVKGGIIYFGVDLENEEEVSVTEWSIIPPAETPFPNSIREYIDEKFERVKRLQHPNLVPYLNINQSENEGVYTIHYLQEFVRGTSLSSFLARNEEVSLDMIRKIARSAIFALRYMHVRHIYHSNFRLSSIHIDNSGNVKLSDHYLFNSCYKVFHKSCLGAFFDVNETEWYSVETSRDLYDLGNAILSLSTRIIVGKLPYQWLQDVEHLELREFIKLCLLRDNAVYWSAQRLKIHNFVRIPLNETLKKFPQLENRNDKRRVEIAVCCTGDSLERENELVEVLLKFEDKGFYAQSLNFNTDQEVLDFCQMNSIPFAIILRSGERGIIRSFECAPYRERVIYIEDIGQYFLRSDDKKLSVSRISELGMKTNIHFIFSKKKRISKKECKIVKDEIIMQMFPELNDVYGTDVIDIFAVILDPNAMNVFKVPMNYQYKDSPARTVSERFSQDLNDRKYIEKIFKKMRFLAKNRPVHGYLRSPFISFLYSIPYKYSMRVKKSDLFDDK